MKILSLFIIALTCYGSIAAQDTLQLSGKSFDSTAFASDDTLTHSDYLSHLGKAFQILNKAPLVEQFVPPIETIIEHLDEDDSALIIIKERLSTSSRGLAIRNLQMFVILLDKLDQENKAYNKKVTRFDSILDETKQQIFLIRKDTVLEKIFTNTSLRRAFTPQIIRFRDKWNYADSTIKRVNILIDQTLARISDNIIAIDELAGKADALAETTAPRIFGKERRYIWEPSTGRASSVTRGFSRTLSDERKITGFYFEHTRNQFYLLLFTGLIFFYWVFYNFRSAKRHDQGGALETMHFNYLRPVPLIASLIFLLNLAPLFDLNAPTVYIESIEFFLMLSLTVFFRKSLSRPMLYLGIAFIILFILLSITRFLGLPFYLQRWWTLCVNAASCVIGVWALFALKKQLQEYKVIFYVTLLFIFFNIMAIVCNVSGRVTLMQILGSTANAALIQAAGLIVFVQLIKEAFLLQIQSSRIKKKYPAQVEYTNIAKGISRHAIFLAIIIWLVVFATNLNLYDVLNDKFTDWLTTPLSLGSISFTLSGVILFLAIIWTAHFLQKYIAYFFGDVGDDAAFDDKGPRSKLLITRLVLLITGFLLAVAASGLPIDKITVVLGALGIGIGLGLQSIVNNFVSGIILIFDRPLRLGDTVEIGDKKGRVKEISVRSSTLLTAEGAEVIIPNGDILSHNIVNWTLSNNYIRSDISFILKSPVTGDAMQGIKDAIQSWPGILAEKEVQILMNPAADKSLAMKVYFWCKDVTKTEQLRSEVYAAVYTYLISRNIEVA
ncbi:MAG: mechanosensitive ion channel domain-containing protein [Ginsengibacter sp.]